MRRGQERCGGCGGWGLGVEWWLPDSWMAPGAFSVPADPEYAWLGSQWAVLQDRPRQDEDRVLSSPTRVKGHATTMHPRFRDCASDGRDHPAASALV